MLKKLKNAEKVTRAGYMANTSRGRVGRGENARFHTFQLDHHDGRTNGRTNGRTDKASYRVACPQLKTEVEAEAMEAAWKSTASTHPCATLLRL